MIHGLHRKALTLLGILTMCNACGNAPSTSSSSEPEQRPSTGPTLPNTSLLLQESRQLAHALPLNYKLADSHEALLKSIACPTGSNKDSAFVGIPGMKAALRNSSGSCYGNLAKFSAWAKAGQWEQFGPSHHHYDWWMFPIDRQSQHGLRYAVYQEDIKALKADIAWLKDYRLGAILLMQSWGWDVKNKRPYLQPAAGQTWRYHDVRLGKLANSLILFEQRDLYDSLRTFVDHLKAKGISLQAWVLKYFP